MNWISKVIVSYEKSEPVKIRFAFRSTRYNKNLSDLSWDIRKKSSNVPRIA